MPEATKFEKMETFNIYLGRGRKPVFVEGIQKVAFQVKKNKTSNIYTNTSTITSILLCIRNSANVPLNCSKHHSDYSTVLSISASICTETF